MPDLFIDEIERLVKLVDQHNIGEITLRNELRKVIIRKASSGSSAAAVVSSVPSPASSSASPQNKDQTRFLVDDLKKDEVFISSPLVGVYHHAEPPVGPGVRVEKGQVVGNIESMKLMNDVVADRDGIVKEVLVEAGVPVEYGQPLFLLEI
jgi:acetyl-CoA carboxylase biotin carboxyl carrier protein